MVAAVTVNAVLPVGVQLQNILTTVLGVLAANVAITCGGPIDRVVIAPGLTVPADSCCATGGQAHVRLSRLAPTRNFPAPDVVYSQVPVLLMAEIEIGVYRCVSGLDDNAYPPGAGTVIDEAVRAMDDLAALRETALTALGPDTPVVILGTSAVGPSGYCAGMTLTFSTPFNPEC